MSRVRGCGEPGREMSILSELKASCSPDGVGDQTQRAENTSEEVKEAGDCRGSEFCKSG